MRPNIKKGKIRGIHARDGLGRLYSGVDVDCVNEKDGSEGQLPNDWNYG